MQQPTTPTRTMKLERLLDFSRSLNQAVELESLLQAISNYICELTLSEVGSVLIFEEETGMLRFMSAPHAHKRQLSGLHVPLENSVVGRAYTLSKPIVIYDAPNEPNPYSDVDQLGQFQTRSIAAVPIQYGSQRLGVLEAVNKLGDSHYSDEDLTILETLAVYTAVALHNHDLVKELNHTNKAMDELERKKSDFIGIASHELRTPLGVILGHAAMLKETAVDPETAAQYNTILNNALHLKEIVEQITAIIPESGQETRLRRQPVSLNQLIKEIIAAYSEAAQKKQISLSSQLPTEDLRVPADADKLALVLGSLFENAVKFTDSGGRILVVAECVPGFAKVSVMDTGIGIPARDLTRIFDRFYQVESHTTRRTSGLGLGLSVSKVMIELHGGQIWAESVEGRGSKFTFILPTS